MKTNPELIRFDVGVYMLLWFTDPDHNSNSQSLCTEFHQTLESAERMAEMLSGPRIILMSTAQNPFPNKNVYWDAIKFYGKNMELNQLTILPDSLRKQFLNPIKLSDNSIG